MHKPKVRITHHLLKHLMLTATLCLGMIQGLAAEESKSPLLVFRIKTITNARVLPNGFNNVSDKSSRGLKLAACRGEYESASLGIYAKRDVNKVQLNISDLRSGKHTVSKSTIEAWVVKCWYQAGRDVMFHDGVKRLVPELLLKDDALVKVDVKKKTNSVRSTAKDGSAKYLPASGTDPKALDALRPQDAETLQPVSIPAKTLKQFWITIHVPANTTPGKYTGSIKVSAEGITPVDIPLELTVHPFELAQPKIIYSIYYPGKLDPRDPRGTIAAHYKSEQQYLAELKDMKAHGVRYPNLWQAYNSGKVARALQLRKQAGLPNDMIFINSPPGAPAGAAGMWKAWNKKAAPFGYKDVYLYGLDEASGNLLRIQKNSWKNVQQAGGKMYASAWKEDPLEVMGSLLNVLVWSGGVNPQKAKNWHKVGSKIFSYSNPQAGVEEPLLYRYNYGLALWKGDYDGAMTFAYQYAYGHIWNDFDTKRFRDHCFAYPTVNGIVGTIQWEGFREGVDDVRYINTLEKAIAKAGKSTVAMNAKRWLNKLKQLNPHQQRSWKAQRKLPENLDEIRGRVVSWIHQLTKHASQ